jgi:hypothetical protein
LVPEATRACHLVLEFNGVQYGSSNVAAHEPLVKVGSEKVVNKLLRSLVFGAARLVLENNIVVPPPFNIEVFGVEERVTSRNVKLALVFLLLGLLFFL